MGMLMMLIFALFVLTLLLIFAHQRYRGPGEVMDMRSLEDYGAPARTLYTSSQVFSLRHRIEITDEHEQVLYRVETQFPSIHDKTDIYAADGRHVAYFERKLITLHEVHYVDMDNGKSFVLSNELFHLMRDVTNIEGLGWVLEGNIIQLNFTITDAAGGLVAVVHQKLMSLHDRYSVDIYQLEYEEEVVAILITLQHMIRDRQAASANTGAPTSS